MSEQSFLGQQRRRPSDFLLRAVHGLLSALQHALDAETLAARDGWLQRLDARSKLLGLGGWLLCAIAVRHLAPLLLLLLLSVALAGVSALSWRRLWRQAWLGVLLFTGPLALPALFLVHGPRLSWLPGVSLPGLQAALLLLGRAQTCTTLVLLLILTTPWTHLLKALRSLRVPLVLVALLGMTHRYLFTLLHSALQLLDARRSRHLGPWSAAAKRRHIAANAGFLLERSLALSQEIHLAMIARGYRGEVHLLQDSRLGLRDAWAMWFFASLGLFILYADHLL